MSTRKLISKDPKPELVQSETSISTPVTTQSAPIETNSTVPIVNHPPTGTIKEPFSEKWAKCQHDEKFWDLHSKSCKYVEPQTNALCKTPIAIKCQPCQEEMNLSSKSKHVKTKKHLRNAFGVNHVPQTDEEKKKEKKPKEKKQKKAENVIQINLNENTQEKIPLNNTKPLSQLNEQEISQVLEKILRSVSSVSERSPEELLKNLQNINFKKQEEIKIIPVEKKEEVEEGKKRKIQEDEEDVKKKKIE